MTETVDFLKNAPASRGRCEPGASKSQSNITPELQSEPKVGCAGCSPLQEPHMLVCSTGGTAKFALRPLRTEGFLLYRKFRGISYITKSPLGKIALGW